MTTPPPPSTPQSSGPIPRGPVSPVKTVAHPSGDEPSPAGASILVVDDNLQNLELLQAYLEDMDADVRVARDGQEALAAVEQRQPDIILLDVMMPRVSGFQACVKIKGNPDTRDIPIIMITALNEVSDVERAVESGADDFLTKPVNKLELLTRVRSLLRVRLLKRQLDRTMDQLKRLKAD